jgi:hypothetical protein
MMFRHGGRPDRTRNLRQPLFLLLLFFTGEAATRCGLLAARAFHELASDLLNRQAGTRQSTTEALKSRECNALLVRHTNPHLLSFHSFSEAFVLGDDCCCSGRWGLGVHSCTGMSWSGFRRVTDQDEHDPDSIQCDA